MGLVLDSSVLIVAERDARPVSSLLATLEQGHGETEIVLSSITVIELENGLHRAQTLEQERNRRHFLDTVFAAIPVEPFTRDMAQIAAKVDADPRMTARYAHVVNMAKKNPALYGAEILWESLETVY